MTKGGIYKVFEDPFTKTKIEGSATIIKVYKDQFENDENYFYCSVRFTAFEGEPIVGRIVDERDLI